MITFMPDRSIDNDIDAVTDHHPNKKDKKIPDLSHNPLNISSNVMLKILLNRFKSQTEMITHY